MFYVQEYTLLYNQTTLIALIIEILQHLFLSKSKQFLYIFNYNCVIYVQELNHSDDTNQSDQ